MTPKLLSVVSDRTGYPAEMLTMDMELESDLGIDSIKRVEILSAMQDLVPELPDVDLAVMASLATLGQITDYLTAQAGGTPSTTPNTPAPPLQTAATTGVGAFGRFVVTEQPLPNLDSTLPGLLDAPLAIVGDPDGIGTALTSVLATAGGDTRLVNTIDEADQHTVIYLGNLRTTTDRDEAIGFNREAFVAAKSFAPRAQSGAIFVAVDDQGGAFATTGGASDRVWASGLTALMRTAAIEWPDAHTKMIDIERDGRSADVVAACIASELLSGGNDREVGLRANGARIGLRSNAVEVAAGVLPIGSSDVVVVSGGGRGVTAATVVELGRSSGSTFVLLGRSPLTDEPAHYGAATDDAALKKLLLAESKETGTKLTPANLKKQVGAVLANREIRTTLDSIEAAGGRASYLAVDITDSTAVNVALDSVRSEVGPITGLIHGAGVLADKLIAEKTIAQFNTVFTTKVDGLRNLLDATANDALAVLCVFSSVAARTGNMGQSDYAMANEVLNKVAIQEHARRGGACVVKSLGWGPWAGGMVTPALKTHFESLGVELIDLKVGARMLVDELSSPQVDQVEIVLGGGVLAPAETSQRVGA
jgi:acyl carrier protein